MDEGCLSQQYKWFVSEIEGKRQDFERGVIAGTRSREMCIRETIAFVICSETAVV